MYCSFDIGASLTLAVQVDILTSVLITVTMAEAEGFPEEMFFGSQRYAIIVAVDLGSVVDVRASFPSVLTSC